MVQINVDLKSAQQKLSNQSLDRGKFAMTNQMVVDMNPFVPMQEGILRGTGHVTRSNDELIWDTVYAARLFYMYMYNYSTPGTGPRWDLKSKGLYMDDWKRVFARGAGW